MFKEKEDLLQKCDQNLFGKKFRSHVVETELSEKRILEIYPRRNGRPSNHKVTYMAN